MSSNRGTDLRPQHQKVAAQIRAEIMSGSMAPGERMPSTAQLIERFGAANATIQKAVASLKSEGFLKSQRGKSVTVRQHIPHVVDAAAYLNASPGGYSYEILDVASIAPPPDIRAGLALEETDSVIRRTRLLSLNGSPVELSHSHYPSGIAATTALSKKARIPGGAPRLLAELGHIATRFTDRISARLPTTTELELLDLPNDVPVIRQLRVIYSQVGLPIEASELIKGGNLYELRYSQAVTAVGDH
jgi:GntR family transcriptional regulator